MTIWRIKTIFFAWQFILSAIIGGIFAMPLCAAAAENSAPAGTFSADEPIALWENFLTSLRRGAMGDAYQMLLPSMRTKISYRDFCVSWHPLGRNYSAVLMPPLFSEFCVAGDLAFLRLGVKQNSTTDFMYAYLSRENERWWLIGVDSLLAAEIITESAAKDFLRQLWKQSPLVRESLSSGKTAALADFKREIPTLFAQENSRRTLANYELEIDNLRGGVIRLRPLHPALRGFEYDGENLRTPTEMPAKILTTEQAAASVAVKKNPLVNPTRSLPTEMPELDDEIFTATPTLTISANHNGKNAKKIQPSAAKQISKTDKPEIKIPRAKLPDPAPDFGDPDENFERADDLSSRESNRSGVAAANQNATFMMPEFDIQDDLLMTPPADIFPSSGNLPRTEVSISK